MKSGVHSSVHLMTANAPSTAVQSHRSLSSGARKSVVGNILSATTTNEFLKRGGTLPPVLPSETCKESSVKRLCKKGRPQTEQKMYPAAETSQINLSVENTHKVTKLDSDLSSKENIDVNDLERKMEQLSSKLSKVQDILCDHMNSNEGLKSTFHNVDKSQRFSAHDYALLMLEMNGNISSHPYDPNEFSDKNGC